MKQTSSGPVRVPGNQLEAVLGLCWPDTLEAARSGFEGVPLEELPPLDRQQTELAMEVLKILFNITFDKGRRSVDEVQKPRHPGTPVLLFEGMEMTAFWFLPWKQVLFLTDP